MHLAAGVAFYALLSIFPMALVLVSIFSFFFKPEEVTSWLVDLFGKETPVSPDFLGETVEGVIAACGPVGIVGLVGMGLSSTLVFAAIMRSINRAWGLVGTGYRPFLRRKLWEFSLLGGMAFLFLLSLVADSLLEILGQTPFPGTEFRLSPANTFGRFFFGLIPVGVMAGILLLLYKFVPTTTVKWRDIWLPSLLGAAALKITNSILGWYVNTLGYYNAVYGSLSSVVVLLIWAYVCANILIVGATLSAVLATSHRQLPSPDSIANP
jgi:membrane protein